MKNNDFKNIVSDKKSNWKEKSDFRIKNKWLIYSSQIARRILAIIEDDKELNQAKLAQSLNVKPQQISKIVKGHENLTLETIYNISKALNFELISFPDYKYSYPRNKTHIKPEEFDIPESTKGKLIPIDYEYMGKENFEGMNFKY